jgi:hypothetical protein
MRPKRDRDGEATVSGIALAWFPWTGDGVPSGASEIGYHVRLVFACDLGYHTIRSIQQQMHHTDISMMTDQEKQEFVNNLEDQLGAALARIRDLETVTPQRRADILNPGLITS